LPSTPASTLASNPEASAPESELPAENDVPQPKRRSSDATDHEKEGRFTRLI
jgi:hypothetical protein